MAAPMIRPRQLLVTDADTIGRYAGAMLRSRGTTLADLYEARIHLEAAAVETLARNRSAADLRRLDAAIAQSEAALSDPIVYGAMHGSHPAEGRRQGSRLLGP
jgi:DNA-binding FadR family transcriptional regulator